MSRTRRPVLTLALLALSSLVLTTGCAAGKDSPTLKPYSPADGVVANSGTIRVLNALVVADSSGGDGVVSLTIVNRGDRDDSLTDLTSPDGTVDLTGTRDLPRVMPCASVPRARPSATIGDVSVEPGHNITLKLTLPAHRADHPGTVVVPATGPYASITPGPETPVGHRDADRGDDGHVQPVTERITARQLITLP